MFKEKRFLLTIITAFALFCSSCGGEQPELTSFDSSVVAASAPVLKRINPTSGKVGDTITVYGFGFSNNPPANIINMGGKTAQATTYSLNPNPENGELEAITFTIPTGVSVGTNSILMIVFELASNNTNSFTVTP